MSEIKTYEIPAAIAAKAAKEVAYHLDHAAHGVSSRHRLADRRDHLGLRVERANLGGVCARADLLGVEAPFGAERREGTRARLVDRNHRAPHAHAHRAEERLRDRAEGHARRGLSRARVTSRRSAPRGASTPISTS